MGLVLLKEKTIHYISLLEILPNVLVVSLPNALNVNVNSQVATFTIHTLFNT